MPVLVPPADDPETLRFVAPWRWSCGYLASLPGAPRPRAGVLGGIAHAGVTAYLSGATRDAALRLMARGDLRIAQIPASLLSDGSARLLRDAGAPSVRERECSLIEIVATGQLDREMLPLWTALAAARGVAHAFGGLVIDPAWPRAFVPSMLHDTMSEPLGLVIAEHVLVMSSLLENGRARLSTLGMERLGIPDLVIESVPANSMKALAAVLNGIAWHLLDVVLATPPADDDSRHVVTEAEFTVKSAWIEDSGCFPRRRGRFIAGDEEPPAVRLIALPEKDGDRLIAVKPPRDWRGGRTQWARGLAEGLGLPWQPPPRPSCGHDHDAAAPGFAGRSWDA